MALIVDFVHGGWMQTKIELPTLPSLYGALLAGADYIIM
jgi:hypothetical protein